MVMKTTPDVTWRVCQRTILTVFAWTLWAIRFLAHEFTGERTCDDYLLSAGAVDIHFSTMNLMKEELINGGLKVEMFDELNQTLVLEEEG